MFVLLSLCALVALVYRILYRCYFGPLARFPGPKLAAVTWLYQFYFDVVRGGRLPWEIARLHEIYGILSRQCLTWRGLITSSGPVIRISPNEIHISDPSFVSVLYTGGGRPLNKDVFAVQGFSVPNSALATADHGLHQVRRAALSPFFSRRAINQITPMIRAKLDVLCNGLEQALETQEAVNFEAAMMALTMDIITRSMPQVFAQLRFTVTDLCNTATASTRATIFYVSRISSQIGLRQSWMAWKLQCCSDTSQH